MATLAPTIRSRQTVILLSPFVVIALAHVTARVTGIWLGVWAWVPVILVFWTTIGWLIAWSGGRESARRWLSRPRGGWGWFVLALVVGLIPAFIFVQNWRLLSPIWIWLPWLLFAFINPWLEEGYWRGLLLDTSAAWPGWLSVSYTSALFAVSHPLMLGVHSLGNRSVEVVISTFIMGVCWALIYRRTGSLRWPVLSHILVDLLNLSVVVFLNLYVPPDMTSR